MTDGQQGPIPEGWYQDLVNPNQQRWWDGTQFTDRVQAASQTGGPVDFGPERYPSAALHQAGPPPRIPVEGPRLDAASTPASASVKRLSRWQAVAVIVAVVVVVTVVVGVAVVLVTGGDGEGPLSAVTRGLVSAPGR